MLQSHEAAASFVSIAAVLGIRKHTQDGEHPRLKEERSVLHVFHRRDLLVRRQVGELPGAMSRGCRVEVGKPLPNRVAHWREDGADCAIHEVDSPSFRGAGKAGGRGQDLCGERTHRPCLTTGEYAEWFAVIRRIARAGR